MGHTRNSLALRINDYVTVEADALQWMIVTHYKKKNGTDGREARRFISSTRDILIPDLKEVASITPDEIALVERSLPATFKEWKETQNV